MKKYISILLALAVSVSLYACTNVPNPATTSTSSTPTLSATVTPSPKELTPEEKAEKQKKIDESLAELGVKEDKMTGTKFYLPPEMMKMLPMYDYYFYPYIVMPKDAEPYLRLVINYYGEDWLFMKRYLLNIDDELYAIQAEGVIEDVDGGKISETADLLVDDEILPILEAIAKTRGITLRYVGKNLYFDRDLNIDELLGTKHVLNAYKLLTE
jgi:hypothetical protein